MKLDSEEILKCLCFVILGYFIAMMFSRMCSCGNRFRVGGEVDPTTECDPDGGLPCSDYYFDASAVYDDVPGDDHRQSIAYDHCPQCMQGDLRCEIGNFYHNSAQYGGTYCRRWTPPSSSPEE